MSISDSSRHVSNYILTGLSVSLLTENVLPQLCLDYIPHHVCIYSTEIIVTAFNWTSSSSNMFMAVLDVSCCPASLYSSGLIDKLQMESIVYECLLLTMLQNPCYCTALLVHKECSHVKLWMCSFSQSQRLSVIRLNMNRRRFLGVISSTEATGIRTLTWVFKTITKLTFAFLQNR